MLVHISEDLVNIIVHHSRVCYPLEACGLIAGSVEGEKKIIKKVYPLHNTEQSRIHFNFAPKEQNNAVKDMRSLNLSPLGNFHSHPESPAVPTEEDIDLSTDPSHSYLILSLKTSTPVLKSFHVDKKTRLVEEETLVVEPSEAKP
ncbi:MAG: M67 family metallopeptidase [Deltaproteobacteria bacterium]|jgi:proteasome lid subunit RPN8/RPN11|nr:M67 family metallopeptidase [Deltaproteobacteria bacterium]